MHSTPRHIYFRADGNAQKGLGHVYRSMALAEMLREHFQCHFVIRTPMEELRRQLEQVCNSVIALAQPADDINEAQSWADAHLTGKELVVLDGYHLDTGYQEVIRQASAGLICIDDIHAFPFVSDVIINPASTVEAADYDFRPDCQLLLGPAYALLRPAFIRAASQQRSFKATGAAFICMGGTDLHNYTLQALQACEKLSHIHSCYAVVGSAYAHHASLKAFADQSEMEVQMLSNLSAEDLLQQMQASEIMICSASTISYECVCAGGPLYVIQTYDNQQALYKALMQAGVAWPFEALGRQQQSAPLLLAQENWIDGQSPKRLSKIVDRLYLRNQIQLRKADVHDLMTYFEWTNDPAVRQNSIQQAAISLENHQSWFLQKIESPHSILYMAELAGEGVGQVRFELREQEVLINYSIAKAFRGRGIGRILMQKSLEILEKEPLNARRLIAWVKIENIASCKVFEQLNFQLSHKRLYHGDEYLVYERGGEE